ncbi:hypothetical protein DESUT3_03670 [Desulfuromonas versatilis]|uniref:Uncharacterized protein n=1 Tax=Desulfuromonas versatilis TaxID=2802975 RepID=A0ABM8HM43_9BACT|nr:hypothetical protein [Desulfuromonas versatilis]BCR03298.1 hypothetical protein DESUT3_03670 [Desulfuromonas versatilis]
MRTQDLKDRWDQIKENLRVRWGRMREEDLDRFLQKRPQEPKPHAKEESGHHADESSGSE